MSNEPQPSAEQHALAAMCTAYLLQNGRIMPFGNRGRFGRMSTGQAYFAIQLVDGAEELKAEVETVPGRDEYHVAAILVDPNQDEYLLFCMIGPSPADAQRQLDAEIVQFVSEEVGQDGMRRMLTQFREAGPQATLRPHKLAPAAKKKKR